MNRVLELQAILPSIDLGAGLEDSNASFSCGGGNCNSSNSNNCQSQATQVGAFF